MARTVLIVDDHPSFRASARAVLEAGDFVVVGEAADGVTAISETARLHPDVILLDVQLPDMTGFDVCGEIARAWIDENGTEPAIVLVSSRDRADYGELVDASCARGFVPKDELSGEALATLVA